MRRMLVLLFVLSNLKTLAQKTGDPSFKFSYELQKKLLSNGNDSLLISISVSDELKFLRTEPRVRVISSLPGKKMFVAKVKGKDLLTLEDPQNIVFVSQVQSPAEELTTGAYDLTLNMVNYVHSRLPQINGDSIRILIKERRFDTSDIDLRGRIFSSGVEAPTLTPHASLMATIIAGGANTSPFARGAAARSLVGSASFLNLFPENDQLILQQKISVENHSYGTVVENFYGNEARAYDLQSNEIPSILHVFSSGNAGNTTNTSGPYSGVFQMSNLTGNFKHAKNAITAGSVDSAGQLMPLSSKGPSYDGRIKPEIMAYGEDGSSGAAATVSGAALLVQDAYKKQFGVMPSSALVKAALLNSADDLHNPYVDYFTGFGKLNAYQAVNAILENRFMEGAVLQHESKSYQLLVPSGISRLKLMLVWNDPAAVANAPKALVNDLDLLLKLPATNENWQPWVLDHSADPTLLQSAPQRRLDTLNNVEQITIDNPLGAYIIEVKGSRLGASVQPFALVYQLDTSESFYWTYPTASDPLIAGNTHWLRWSSNMTGTGVIEYALNDNNWRTLGPVPDLSNGYFRWAVPDTVTTAVLRMRFPAAGTTAASDSFTISRQLNMEVGFNCADSFLLHWNNLSAASYIVYELNGNYLAPSVQTPDTAIIFNKQQHTSLYYSVAPNIEGRPGIRSNTINYLSAGPECYIRTFFLQSQAFSTASFTAELGTLFNVAEVALEKLVNGSFNKVQSISQPSSLVFNLRDSLRHQGENRYRLSVQLANGTVLYSNVETVFHLPASPVFVYPNPVSRQGQMKVITNESGRYTMSVFDSNGKLILTQLLTSTLTLVNSNLLPRGMYVIRITDRGEKPFSQKIVVY